MPVGGGDWLLHGLLSPVKNQVTLSRVNDWWSRRLGRRSFFSEHGGRRLPLLQETAAGGCARRGWRREVR
uniref:Uncharacterized protein n=1 Tax=Arundo donax TaxID=35708 RepID=A0A0A8Y0N2_ARUDO